MKRLIQYEQRRFSAPSASCTRRGAPGAEPGILRALSPIDRHGLPTDDLITIPGQSGDRNLHIAVSAAGRVARPSAEQRQIAVLLAQLGTR